LFPVAEEPVLGRGCDHGRRVVVVNGGSAVRSVEVSWE